MVVRIAKVESRGLSQSEQNHAQDRRPSIGNAMKDKHVIPLLGSCLPFLLVGHRPVIGRRGNIAPCIDREVGFDVFGDVRLGHKLRVGFDECRSSFRIFLELRASHNDVFVEVFLHGGKIPLSPRSIDSIERFTDVFHQMVPLAVTDSSASALSAESLRSDNRSLCARNNPTGTTATNVTSQSMMPQLTASSFGTICKTWSIALMVASCEPPPTPGNCTIEPIMLDPIRRRTFVVLMACIG